MLTHLSLFSGIGGLDLAAEAAGFVTVGQCEWADYPTKVLEKHWPNVPRWRNVKTLTGESFYERTGLRTVDVISGGFPCQPFSVAGKQRGKGDDRYLWPEMLRVIHEIRPAWVLGENVPGIVRLALDEVLADLENEGYAVQTFNIPACGVDAPHRRARIAIIANTSGECCQSWRAESKRQQRETGPANGCTNVADSESARNRRLSICQRKPQQEVFDVDRQSKAVSNAPRWREQRIFSERPETWGSGGGDWWAVEPDVGRVAHGVPNRVDRIKCLGNAVVPQQFYPFFAAIAKIETTMGVM